MIWKAVNLKLSGTLKCCAKISGKPKQKCRSKDPGHGGLAQGHANCSKDVFTVLKAAPDLLFSPTTCWATKHGSLSDFVTRAAHHEPGIIKTHQVTEVIRCKAIHHTFEMSCYESDPIRLEDTSNLQCRWQYHLFQSHGCLSHSF